MNIGYASSGRDVELAQSFWSFAIGLEVSHVWRGAGSTLFLEFGPLHPRLRANGTPRTKTDGTPSNPQGVASLMIEWSWRIEDARSIICASWSDDQNWEDILHGLEGLTIEAFDLFGALPEICVNLSDKKRVVSFMTSHDDPKWTLFDRRKSPVRWLTVSNGLLVVEQGAVSAV